MWGKNEILRLMFHKDVLVLGLTDGVLCGSTIFCLLLQRAIEKGYLSWNRSGWITQNVGLQGPRSLPTNLLFRMLPYHRILTNLNFKRTRPGRPSTLVPLSGGRIIETGHGHTLCLLDSIA